MDQLILHHVYRSAAPFVDVSGHGNHAQAQQVDWEANGMAVNSGAAVFNGVTSRTLVPLSPIWLDLYALRVEALVRFDPQQGAPGQPVRVRRHLIVEGPLSFSLFIRHDRTVAGMVMGLVKDEEDADNARSASNTLSATLTGGGSLDPFDTLVATAPDTLPIPPGHKLDWIPVASTAEFAPDGQTRTLEPGRWTRITFAHNGTSLWLYVDGVLAGVRHDIVSPVLPVQGQGVHIGWAPGSFPDTLRGQLDELRIWKYDPHQRTKKFFCRPMAPATEACWRFLLGRIEKLAADPETRAQTLAVLDCLHAAERELMRAVFQGGQPAVEQASRFGRRYDELWRRGQLDSAAMRELFGELTAWLGATAGDAWWAYLHQVLACIQTLKGLDFGPEFCALAECDPAFAELLNGINRNLLDDLLPCAPGGGRKSRRKQGPDPHKQRPDYDEAQAPSQEQAGSTPYAQDPEKEN